MAALPPQPQDLALVADVLSYLSPDAVAASQESESNKVQALLTAVSDLFDTYTGRTIRAQADISEIRNGNGISVLWPRNRPIFKLTSLSVNGTTVSIVTDAVTSGALLNSPDQIELRGSFSGVGIWSGYGGNLIFAKGVQNVKIVYSAGYNTPGQAAQNPSQVVQGAPSIPIDLKQAAIEQTTYMYKRRRNIGHMSTGLGPESVTFMTSDLTPLVQTILNRYRTVAYLGNP